MSWSYITTAQSNQYKIINKIKFNLIILLSSNYDIRIYIKKEINQLYKSKTDKFQYLHFFLLFLFLLESWSK